MPRKNEASAKSRRFGARRNRRVNRSTYGIQTTQKRIGSRLIIESDTPPIAKMTPPKNAAGIRSRSDRSRRYIPIAAIGMCTMMCSR